MGDNMDKTYLSKIIENLTKIENIDIVKSFKFSRF